MRVHTLSRQRAAKCLRRAGMTTAALVSVAAALVANPAPAHAIEYGFVVEPYSVQVGPGAYEIHCLAFWDDPSRSPIVVTQVTISECYNQDGAAALPITMYGDAAATGATATGLRTTLDTCVRAQFVYLNTTIGSVPTPGTYDSGRICTDRWSYHV